VWMEEQKEGEELKALAAQIAQVQADIKEAQRRRDSASPADKEDIREDLRALRQELHDLRQEKAILLKERQGRMSTVDCVV